MNENIHKLLKYFIKYLQKLTDEQQHIYVYIEVR